MGHRPIWFPPPPTPSKKNRGRDGLLGLWLLSALICLFWLKAGFRVIERALGFRAPPAARAQRCPVPPSAFPRFANCKPRSDSRSRTPGRGYRTPSRPPRPPPNFFPDRLRPGLAPLSISQRDVAASPPSVSTIASSAFEISTANLPSRLSTA